MTLHSTAATPPRTEARRTALVAGALYLVTFATSIPTLGLYGPLRDHPGFVLGAGSATGVLAAAVLEVVLAASCVGTAVVLFPVAKRQSETAALGFLAARVLEAGLILLGVTSVLAVVALRGGAGTSGLDAPSLLTAGRALSAVYDGTFLLGQSLMPVASALCLGSVMIRSGLVPRAIPLVGLVGAPLLLASDAAVLVGAYDRMAPLAALAALPVAAWELALGVHLVLRGFRPSAVLAQHEAPARAPEALPQAWPLPS